MPYGTLALDTISTSGNLTITGNTAVSGNITITGNVISATAFHANVRSQAANTAPIFQDINGTQIGTLCRAWVACNGSSTIFGSFNVTSVTDNGTGSITVNFTNPMPDGNYAVVALNRYRATGSFETIVQTGATNTGNVTFGVADIVSGATVEVSYIAVAIFR